MRLQNHIVILALGSNIGDRISYLEKAKEELANIGILEKESNIYDTEPVGFADQDWFLNCVVQMQTSFNPEELLEETQKIEKKLDKNKIIDNGPRAIDIDIIFFDNEIINTPNLKIPHPRMHERRFVLTPLAEIAPDWIHPISKLFVRDLLKNTKDGHDIRLYTSL